MAPVAERRPPPSPRSALPRGIARTLSQVDRRLRAARMFSGLGAAAAAATLGAAAGMTIDFLGPIPPIVRWGAWGAWVGMTAWLILVALGRALRGVPGGPVTLAALIERRYPELVDRLTGAVDLARGPAVAHGSPALIAALTSDAESRVGAVDPAAVAPLQRSRRRLGLGAGGLALWAASAWLVPDPLGVLSRRFLAPWSSVERVGRLLVSVAPGDATTTLGDGLTITSVASPRPGLSRLASPPRAATLEWTDQATGRTRRWIMSIDDDKIKQQHSNSSTFRIDVPRVGGSARYRVVAGGGLSGRGESRWHRIEAVAPPAIATVEARVEAPAYTGFPAVAARDPARVEAWESSRVALKVAADRPVVGVAIDWPVAPGPAASDSEATTPAAASRVFEAALDPSGRTATVVLPAEVSGEFSLRLRDAHGVVSRPEPPRRLIVRPDAPPTVFLRDPEGIGLDQARADDVLRVGVVARDDAAVVQAELHYTIERADGSTDASVQSQTGRVAARLGGLGTDRAEGDAVLGLARLKLRPGDAVAYRIRVVDNRPAPRGPNVAWSSPRRLAVVADAPPLWTRRGAAERQELQSRLDALKKSAADNRHETELLRYAADAVQRGNGAWDRERRQALADREAAAREVADKLNALARDLDDDAAFAPLARPARQIAQVEAEAARAALDQARQTDDDARRLNDLRTADARLGAVSNRLEELQRRLDALARREADRQRFRELADRQAEVADRADEADADRASLDRLDAEQNAVRQDLDKLVRDAPGIKAELLQSQAVEAEALALRARALADRQREQARAGAGAEEIPADDPDLRRIVAEQQALEDDARRLAADVDGPLAENGRGRLNVELLRQAAEPIARGDLAQARQRLDAAEAELRRLGRDLDDAPLDLKATARRLARGEERARDEAVNALAESRNKPGVSDAGRAEVVARLRSVAALQAAVAAGAARLAESTARQPEAARPRLPVETARAAAEAARRAVEALDPAKFLDPRAIESRLNEARVALNRLANDLPDPWRVEEPARRAFAESRQPANEAIQNVERHLRETEAALRADPARAAAALAERLGSVADRARQSAERLDRAAAEAQVHPRIEPQRARAAGRARALAEAVEALRAAAKPPNGAGASFDPARARALRESLAAAAINLRAGLDRLDQKLNHQNPADDLARELAAEQRALAADAATATPAPERAAEQLRLATALHTLRDAAPDAPAELAEATRRADRAVELLRQSPNPNDPPTEAARQAGQAVDELARRLNDGAPGETPGAARPSTHPPLDPDLPLTPEQAEAARDLARRERRLRERLQSLLADRAAPQRDLRRESAELGRDAAGLRDRVRDLSPRARGPADESASLLGEHAPRAMDDAAHQLAQGLPRPARDAQRRAAELAQRGAQAVDDLADALRADARENAAIAQAQAPSPSPSSSPRDAAGQPADRDAQAPLAQSRQAMRQATDHLARARAAGGPPDQQPALRDARQAMRSAAEKLQAAAESQSQRGTDQGRAQARNASAPDRDNAQAQADSATEPRGQRAGATAPEELKALQDLVRRRIGRAWGELPGHLRTEILQTSRGRYRDDYARLIQLYFREIAAGADRDRDRDRADAPPQDHRP